ncbi:hypothetical protein PG987_012511 [Apiospora arundinis]|uniref:Uncharacterized protein n=1 Tax=Apiospora arundinis TaxID=335852 RepID=A0ABR2IG13_9PEZI
MAQSDALLFGSPIGRWDISGFGYRKMRAVLHTRTPRKRADGLTG